uniref:ATP synthase complex subunit 8 n=1 Tax=Janus compressus TaxID=1385266 RepID=A0A1W6Q595_9HYME|nr:ATP synthase F0 subunit 8 [Janus compressus]
MPQMSPMNWILMLIMFTLIMITCMSLIYFNYLPTPKKYKLTNKYKNNIPTSWKW